MFSIFWPIGGALGLAFLSDLATAPPPQRRRKSIEACTALCQVSWIKEDGVVKVYAETLDATCARIIVEMEPGASPPPIPGEIEGHPVVIRMGGYGAVPQSNASAAITELIGWFEHHGRALRPFRDGFSDYTPASGAYILEVLHKPQTVFSPSGQLVTTSGPPTEQDRKYIAHLGRKHEIIFEIENLGDRSQVQFFPLR